MIPLTMNGFIQNAESFASLSLNYPESKAGLLEVINTDVGYVLQKYTILYTNTVYLRWSDFDGSWKGWQRL